MYTDKKEIRVAWDRGEERGGRDYEVLGKTFGGDGDVYYLDVVMVSQVYHMSNHTL